MAEPYIGEIRMFPYTYAPEFWLECDGQAVSTAQYQALYAVIGLAYTPNPPSNPTSFNLPNLLGSAPVGMGQGTGLSNYNLSPTGVGATTVTLTQSQLPSHTHGMVVVPGDTVKGGQGIFTPNPAGSILTPMYTRPDSTTNYTPVKDVSSSANTNLGPQALAQAGSSSPHSNQQPFLSFRFCIATLGVFPTRP